VIKTQNTLNDKRVFGKSYFYLSTLVFFIGIFLFFPALGRSSLWDNDETTYAEIAKEMLQTHHWLTLHFNYQPWFCHPPLYMWLTAILFKFFGWNEWTARFFPALFAVLGMFVVFEMGVHFWNVSYGFMSAVILGTTLQYLVQGRMATMDSLLMTLLLLSFYFAWRAFEEKKEIWWLLFFVSSAFATLAKGVFGLAYPIFIFGVFLLVRKEFFRWKEVPWIKGISLYLLISAPWFIYETVKYGSLFVSQVFYFYTFKRVVSPILNQSGPWYYYIPILFLGFFPWSGFIPTLIIKGWENRTEKKIQFLGTLVVATFIFFTLVSTKLPNYIFFLYPPLALLLSRFWNQFSFWEKMMGIAFTLFLALFLGAGLEVFAMEKLLPKEMSLYASHLFPLFGILILGCLLAFLVLFLRKENFILPLMALGMGVFWYAFNIHFSPILEFFKPMKPMAQVLRLYLQKDPEPVVVYHVPGEASLVFYGNTPILNIKNPALFFRLWKKKKLYCFLDTDTLDAFKSKLGIFYVLGHERTLWLLANFSPNETQR
jgi:4-amino-4-deoxy-L-arabinose transferase-like glycosyltransferase